VIKQISTLSETTFRKDHIKDNGFIVNGFHTILKGLSLMTVGLFGYSPTGVTIGFTEHEAVVQGSGGILGVYGLFKLVLDKHQKRISIENIEYLSPSYQSFILKMMNKNHKLMMIMVLMGIGFGISFIFSLARIIKNKRSWKKVIKKYFSKQKKKKEKIYVQKKLYCEICNSVPANIMFDECGHLIYCWDCFKNLENIELNTENNSCASINCLDCNRSNTTFTRIVYP
jgi:hypothetical protein